MKIVNDISHMIKSSVYSSIIEVFITYPVDYYKTLTQNKIKNKFNILLKNPYKGSLLRFCGLVPMRTIYWTSIDYFRRYKSSIETSIYVCTLQTLIDYPAEQMKMNRINNIPVTTIAKKPFLAFTSHYSRNFLFTYTFLMGNIYLSNSFISSMFASIISQPLDSLKTHYQSNSNELIKYSDMEFYFRGWKERMSMTFLSVGIGWSTYQYFQNSKKYFQEIER